jgi:hypothetical protein
MERLVAESRQPHLERDLIPGRRMLAKELARAGDLEGAERAARLGLDLAVRRAGASPERADVQDDQLVCRGVLAFVLETAAARPGLAAPELSTVGYLQSGVYLTPTISMPDPTGTRFTSTGNRPTVTIRPDQLSDPELSDPTIAQWYDVNAYGAPAIGQFGTATRGSVEGPGLNLWHFGMHKRFRLTNRADSPTLRIELTSTNIFNQPQYANPNMTVTPTNVNRGRISAIGGPSGSIQQAGMRSMRLGFRLEW